MPYQPTGTPLTDEEREILDILQEECAEVILAVSKIKRFGRRNINPKTDVDNVLELSLEVGDLDTIRAIAQSAGLIEERAVHQGRARKIERLREFSNINLGDL